MPGTGAFTVDGFIGPGIAVQAKVFANIDSFTVDISSKMLKLTDINGKVLDVAIGTALTFVVTIAGGNYTVTIAD